MSKKQTIIWTALPNGSDGPNAAGTTLRLSVLASPRLWNDDASVAKMALSDFPDFLDWPLTAGGATFEVSFNGGAALPATIVATKPLRSDLWKALFHETTPVIPFKFQNLSGLEILTFSSTVIHDTIKEVFQTVATDPAYGGGTKLPPREVLGDDPILGEIATPVDPPPDYVPIPKDKGVVFVGTKGPEPDSPLPPIGPQPTEPEPPHKLGCGCGGCLAAPVELLRRFLKWLGMLATLPFTMGMGGGGAWTPLAAPATKRDAFDQLGTYVKPTSKISQSPQAADLKDKYDFHQMVATLGDYPNLLRYLGLVFDLEVTLTAALPANGTVTVTPTLVPAVTTTPYTPRTHYEAGNGTFIAQPSPVSDLRNGLLRVDDTSRFRVLQLDVAGGGIKVQSTATTIAYHHRHANWPVNEPKEQGLPSLQTAGLSIVRIEAAARLHDRFVNSWALDVGLRAVDHSAPVEADAPAPKMNLWAEDLVRGYRVDVFDDKSNAWHSLCRRVGVYTFGEGGGAIALPPEEDEGMVQMSATEPVPGAGPRVLRAHESLFTWNGWSLGAPRYGKTIVPNTSRDPEDPTQVAPPSNAPATPFKMVATFTPRPKSLPRLRYGYSYRLRVRAADLAGNSVFGPDDAAFGVTQAEVTPEVKYRRFEPVAPPMLMLQAKPAEGESLERLVVRSKFDDSAALIRSRQTARHIVAPKTSQLMAEHHRKFDTAPAMTSDGAAYDLAGREAGSLTHRVDPVTGNKVRIDGTDEVPAGDHTYWVQAKDTFDLAYLPDPYARGVLLLGLPGMAAPDDIIEPPGPPLVNKIPFDAWPNPKPFRLRVTGLEAGAAPATPAWDALNHVLDVQVAQGETYEVRISSYFHASDLENMGVWAWTAEKAPPDLNDLRTSAIAGRNWLHLPFRTLVLVHAVQQPLAIPTFDSIKANKKLNETIATLDGKFLIDAKSTGKVDVRAAWRDPFDDLRKPAFNEATDFLDFEMQLAEVRIEDPKTDLAGYTPLQHPVGDTKYHAVTYTPTASTRFREYFPPAITADPKNLIRPTSTEAAIPTTPVDVLNSARPDPPKPLYIVPLFEWERGGAALKPRSKRNCAGLRVYMERPWYSSGAGELLGVTLRPPSVALGSDEAEQLKKYTSEWGMDPLWPASATFPLMTPNFRDPAVPPMKVQLAEIDADVDVVGYEPKYDAARNLWYCDVLIDPGTAYFPMVKFALARFQPKSVPGAHISTTVPANFIQLVPHRSVDYDVTSLDATGMVLLEVSGPAYVYPIQREQFRTSQMIVRLEQRRPDLGNDEIGWELVTSALMQATNPDPDHVVWQGRIKSPLPRPTPLRIVVIELEMLQRDNRGDRDALHVLEGILGLPDESIGLPAGYRATFADAVEV